VPKKQGETRESQPLLTGDVSVEFVILTRG
jgi:hypothetical protein